MSIPGITKGIGSVLGGGAGAIGGAYMAGINEEDIGVGAGIGAGVGAALPFAFMPAMAGIGAGAMASVAPIGEKALGTAQAIPKIAENILGVIGASINGSSNTNMLGTLLSPVRRYANAINNLSGHFVDVNTATETIARVKKKNVITGKRSKVGGVKVKPLGHAAIALGATIEGLSKAKDTLERSRMGTMDGHITRATPRIPSYQLNSGATGDLVFALNANRKG